MRVLKSVLVAVAAGAAGFVAAAVVLAVIGLAQAGHGGRAWTDVSAVDRWQITLSVADLVAVSLAAVVATTSFVIAYRQG